MVSAQIDDGASSMKQVSGPSSATIPERSTYDNTDVIIYRGDNTGTYDVFATINKILPFTTASIK